MNRGGEWIGVSSDWTMPLSDWQAASTGWVMAASQWQPLAGGPWTGSAALDGAWLATNNTWGATQGLWHGAELLWAAPSETSLLGGASSECPADVDVKEFPWVADSVQ